MCLAEMESLGAIAALPAADPAIFSFFSISGSRDPAPG